MKEGLLIKYGEIALRGKNRGIFEDRLANGIRRNIGNEYKVKREQGRLLVEPIAETDKMNYEKIIPKAQIALGATSLCPCIISQNFDIDDIKIKTLQYLKEHYDTGTYTFKIAAKRADKKYPYTSLEIAAEVGGYIYENMDNFTVDVVNPAITVFIEIRTSIYIYSKIIKAVGGLPQDPSTKAVLLLSGGIDSPVAGFLTARRGVGITAVYFHAPPYTSDRAKEKVIDLSKRLAQFTGGLRLHVVPFTAIQLMLYENIQHEKLTILLKRTMIRLSEKLAISIKANALILGDSISQVASQTLQSMQAIESAATLPLIRPLATMDKQQIIDIAIEIDTFDISIRPYEDCCTIFVAKHPETKPKVNIIENIEDKILNDLNTLIDEAINNIEIIDC